MEKKGAKSKLGWLGLLLALLVINILASFVHFRVDLTEENRYSLTRTTKDLVRNLEEPLLIQVFLKGDFPSEFRKLSNTTNEFLNVLRDVRPSAVQYKFINPNDEVDDGRSWGDTLQSLASPH
jgi:ABC-type uncharacterized transport system involved in gliding motility auxiliary subunit